MSAFKDEFTSSGDGKYSTDERNQIVKLYRPKDFTPPPVRRISLAFRNSSVTHKLLNYYFQVPPLYLVANLKCYYFQVPPSYLVAAIDKQVSDTLKIKAKIAAYDNGTPAKTDSYWGLNNGFHVTGWEMKGSS